MTTTTTKNESLPELLTLLARVYADAYQAGHDATVEFEFVDVQYSDRDTYWLDRLRERDDVQAALTREATTEGVGDASDLIASLQSVRDRVGPVLAARYGDAFDGDMDTLLDAINHLKRATPPAPQRMAQTEREILAALEAAPAGTFSKEAAHKAFAGIAQPPHQDRGEVEQRARELLASAYERDGWIGMAAHLRGGKNDDGTPLDCIALRAITAALTEAKQQDDTARERALLAEAIANAGIKCGLLRPDIEGLTGPQLLMTVDDMADALNAKQQGPGEAVADGWEDNFRYLLERCPYTLRSREGGGPENVVHSAVLTFTRMEHLLQKGAPQVEAKRQTGEGLTELDRSIINEAAEVLEAVGVSGVALPANWRWPLADELSGIAAAAKPSGEGIK